MIRALLALLLFTGAAAAEDRRPMTGAEFDAATRGWTLHFQNEAGDYFGSEQYLPDGRTIWLPRGGYCERGVWAADRGRICFSYGALSSCWAVSAHDGDQIYAESANPERPDLTTQLWSFRRDRRPLVCPDGPGV